MFFEFCHQKKRKFFMAPNKFATMMHRKTNKISLVLIYAVLEWILIALLFLNSLFSFLIIKFAEYFGLKPPCLWCTRLDHIFDPAKRDGSLRRDLLCEAHSKEISQLGYCGNHGKLVESREMCADCSSSRPEPKGFSKNAASFPRMKDFGMIPSGEEKFGENGEVCLNCSCCGLCLDDGNDVYSSYILLKTSSWDVLECDPKKNLIVDHDYVQECCDFDKKLSDISSKLWADDVVLDDTNECEMVSEVEKGLEVAENEMLEEANVEDNGNVDVVVEIQEENGTLMVEKLTVSTKDKSVQACFEADSPVEVASQHLEFFLDYSGHKLVPVELVDSMEESVAVEDHFEAKVQDSSLEFGFPVEEKDGIVMVNVGRSLEVDDVIDLDINEEPKSSGLDAVNVVENKNSLAFHSKDVERFMDFHAPRISSELASECGEVDGEEGGRHCDVITASEDVAQMMSNENEADISIGTEIPDLDITDEIQNLESDRMLESSFGDPLASSSILFEAEHHGLMQIEEQMVELKPLSVQETDHVMNNNQPSFFSELYEIEEDKVPDTPTSVDSLNHLNKKSLLLEKKDSGAEESLDGSVSSELEGGDGAVTVEKLKSALRAERKTLQALYAELEEERSASAVAANQTMAMINRLQEEKAAMQMEALQYQRMMDEQSEYDQEALELLNELMVKREKEKLELEKELEACRKKLSDYETKEKMRVMKRSKDGSARSGFSSASCSNGGEESDGLSIDLNQEAKEEDGFYHHHEFTPVDTVASLNESLADFEEERFSILEELRMLEQKLMNIDDVGHDKERCFDSVRELEDPLQENGHTHFNGEENGHANGFTVNGKHDQQRVVALQNGKSLLPLFDAISCENGDDVPNGNANGIDSNGDLDRFESSFTGENKKSAIEAEFDHLYQRLQAFEADREFLKHCVSSLNKGDKGMDLLQEILQHLRDLRHVELQARNVTENAVS